MAAAVAAVLLLPPAAGLTAARNGVVRGIVELRRPPRAVERRPGVADLGAPSTPLLASRQMSVVYLEAAPRGAFEQIEPIRAVMDQRNETFVPHVLAVTTGTTVDFPNSDRIYHNVFSLSKTQRFDLGRYAVGHSKAIRFDRPGIVRVFCDIHSHMNAFILVFSHPFFAVTDADGRYRIDNIPPGTYTSSPGTRGSRPSRVRSSSPTAARPSSISCCDDAPLIAPRPHLPDERAAGGAVDRRRDLPGERARHERDGDRAAERDRVDRHDWCEQLRTTRAETFTLMARLIADAPRLKAAVDTNDPPTVQDTAADYQAQLHSNLLLVTNRTGRVLATVGATPREARGRRHSAGGHGRAGRESLRLLPRSPTESCSSSRCRSQLGVAQPDMLGTLSVGFLLDDALADQLKQITGSDIAFGMDGKVLSQHASTRVQTGAVGAAQRTRPGPQRAGRQ